VLYEVEDLSVLTGEDYLAKANAPSELTQRTTPFVKNSVRGITHVKKTLGIGTGGHALTLRFNPLEGDAKKLESYLVEEAMPALAALPEIVGVHLLVADPSASGIVPVERKGRPTAIPNWVVVVEGISLLALNSASHTHLESHRLHAQGCAEKIARETYNLQLIVPRPH
jgi:hypothetical protein